MDEKMIAEFEPTKAGNSDMFALACAILASMTSIILGYDIGVMSGAAIYVKNDLKLTDGQIEVLVGVLHVASIVGSCGAGRTSDRIGRRHTIVLASGFFFLGAIFMGFATGYALLVAGRIVAGLGVGYGLMIAPVYTAEVSPDSSRGFLTSFPDVFLNVGILVGYVSNFIFSKFLPLQLGWRFMLGITAIPSVFLGLGVIGMPESPRWLVMQGRQGDAKRVLDKTSDCTIVAELRLANIKHAVGIPLDCMDDVVEVSRENSHGKGVWKELLILPTPSVRRIVIAALGIHIFQQASGIDAAVLYTPRIFMKAGLKKEHDQLLATVAVGCIKTTCILVATFMVDRIGRRPLLLSSMGGMLLSLIALGSSLTAIDKNPDQKLTWAAGLAVTAVMSYVATFSIGMGPVTWIYCSEILPLRLRAQGTSVAVMVNRAVSGAISLSFLSLSRVITMGGAFFSFAAVAAVAWLFLYFSCPETHGRTLEEMEELFVGKRAPDETKPRMYK